MNGGCSTGPYKEGCMKKIRAITIREDQDKWLRDHRELNFSAFVQKRLDEEIDARFHRGAGSP